MARDEAVADLQRRLNAAGEKLVVDGRMGPKTQAAMGRHPEIKQGGAPAAVAGGGMTDQQVREEAERRYGGSIGAYLDNPEVGPLLRQLANGEIDQMGFEGRLRQTDFWKNNRDTARAWDLDKQNDPATAGRQIESRVATMRATASSLGIKIPDERLRQLAEDSLRLGWNEQQQRASMAGEISYQAGNAGAIVGEIRELGASYALQLNEYNYEDLARRLTTGELGRPELEQWMKDQAKSRWPGLAASIDAGHTVTDVTDQYGSVVEKVLGTPKATIDWTQGKWNQALYQVDQKTGVPRVMTYAEWETALKSQEQYGWRWTDNAKEEAINFATNLAQAFGKRK